jgi:PII-like signaling protein
VNDDCLKLTTYFGERDRTGDRFVADALLDLYGAHAVQTSILLRGVQGFGLKHHLRTDRLLSLSEDLPLVAAAVDKRERIERLLDDVVGLKSSGLLTLERARLISGEIEGAEIPEELGEAVKLTIYIGRQQRARGMPAFIAVCDLLHRRGISGATALLGVDGTMQGRRQRARFFARNSEVPMMVIAVGSSGSIERALPELGGLLRAPLITLERIRVCKRDGELLALPESLPHRDGRGMEVWQKLMVYVSEAAMSGGNPIHLELIRRLRKSGASGVTSLRGVWGFHGDHPPHGDRLTSLRRHVPVVSVIVDAPERIAESFEIVDELTAERGLVTSEMVPAMSAVAGSMQRSSLRLARIPHPGRARTAEQ